MPRAFAGPTRPSCRNTRPASRRAAARSATSVATAMSASIAAAASASLATAASNASASSSPTSGETSSNAGCCWPSCWRPCVRGARSRPGRESGLEARRGATRRALGFSLGVRGLRRVGVGGPQPVQQLVDHRLGRAVHTVGDADAAGERGVGGVARGVAAGVRLAAQRGQAGQHQREVDRARARTSPSARRGARGWPGSAPTEKSTHRPASPLTDDVIARSPASSW